MSDLARSRAARWLVPAGVVAVVAGGVVLGSGVAGASPSLPPKTPAELLAAVAKAAPTPFSGTVVESTQLGLPDLPGTSSTSLSWQSLLMGTHTANVWVASPQQTRVALVGNLAESDVVRDGRDVWVWSSSDNTVEHLVLPQRTSTPNPAEVPAAGLDPASLAQRLLAAVDPTTTVTVDGTGSVAGRAAYELVLTPRGTGSLVSRVRIAIDSATMTPLRVSVYAVGQADPAFQTGFTAITFERPDSSVFAFAPPRGAQVTTKTLPDHAVGPSGQRGTGAPAAQGSTAATAPRLVGSGWSTVVVASGLPSLANGVPTHGNGAGGSGTAALDILLRSTTPVSGAFGSGRLLETSLVSVLLLDDGRVLAGAVTPSELELAALTAR